MKKIILIRHAKSAWDHPWLDDFERPLAERGLRDAPQMAASLKNRGITVDLICSSTAKRAKQTACLTAEVLGYPEKKNPLGKIALPCFGRSFAAFHSVPIGSNPNLGTGRPQSWTY